MKLKTLRFQNLFPLLWVCWILIAFLLFFWNQLLPSYPESWLPEKMDEDHVPPGLPTGSHWFGTDELGRDLLIRLLLGTAYSLGFGLTVSIASCFIALSAGIVTSFLSPRWKDLSSHFIEILAALPFLPLALSVAAFCPGNIFLIGSVKILLSWGTLAQIIRIESENLLQGPMILAAKAQGLSPARIAICYLVPSLLSVLCGFFLPLLFSSLLSLTALDFWGLGFPIPVPTLSEGFRQYLDHPESWWLWVFPLLLLMGLLGGLRFFQQRFFSRLPPLIY